MNEFYNFNDYGPEKGMLENIISKEGFPKNLTDTALKDYTFFEYSLEELGLPSHEQILEGVMKIKDQVGVKGWSTVQGDSKNYQGFSLTYNPDFHDSSLSIYHQTWGSNKMDQIFGRKRGIGQNQYIKNTYYDSFSFRKMSPIVDKELGFFLDKFSSSLIRSRCAFLNLSKRPPNSDKGWHVDEPPYCLFRINIPLQTAPEYVLEIKGEDEQGNSMTMSKHLELGKLYIWNTRIPHRVCVSDWCDSTQDRIHLVLGFSPWFTYDNINDCYTKSPLWGLPLKEIISNKLFLSNQIS
jgi:hypothetical protein